MELAVDQRDELVERRTIAIAPGDKQAGDFRSRFGDATV